MYKINAYISLYNDKFYFNLQANIYLQYKIIYSL